MTWQKMESLVFSVKKIHTTSAGIGKQTSFFLSCFSVTISKSEQFSYTFWYLNLFYSSWLYKYSSTFFNDHDNQNFKIQISEKY